MKKLLILLAILVIGVGVYFYFLPQINTEIKALTAPPCTIPISYAVGTIDQRFGVSKNQVIKDAQTAANIWNTAYGKQLYMYDPNAKLKISLVYDERQAQQVKLDQQVKDLQSSQQNLQPTEDKYNSLVADFRTRLANLNAQISYWNSHGGAPPDVYAQLKAEQSSLKNEVTEINTLAQELNKSAIDYNAGVDNLNQTIQNLNTVIQNKPEEGIYDPNQDIIELYVDVNHDEFIHTLTHELGHALGLEHDEGATSIMFPYTSQSIKPSTQDLAALQTLCTSPVTAQTIIDRAHNQIVSLLGIQQ